MKCKDLHILLLHQYSLGKTFECVLRGNNRKAQSTYFHRIHSFDGVSDKRMIGMVPTSNELQRMQY